MLVNNSKLQVLLVNNDKIVKLINAGKLQVNAGKLSVKMVNS